MLQGAICDSQISLIIADRSASRFAKAAGAITVHEIQGLSYLQVESSGLANSCHSLANGSSDVKGIKPGAYTLENMCVEPTNIQVKEESQFKAAKAESVDTKFLTRLTYTLDGASVRRCLVVVEIIKCYSSATGRFSATVALQHQLPTM